MALSNNSAAEVDARQVPLTNLSDLAAHAAERRVVLTIRNAMWLSDENFAAICVVGKSFVRMDCTPLA
ncbi:hypothetical protein EON82_22315 [bacterium]|nr:MAG: hypothetical protein EON82_22315 [bacterium]